MLLSPPYPAARRPCLCDDVGAGFKPAPMGIGRGTPVKKRYRYTGKERDEESGLYYFGARYYSSATGIFISTDPLLEKYPNISPYAYCMDNPVKFIDPDGREFNEHAEEIYSKAVENDYWGSEALKADLNEMRNSETLFESSDGKEEHISESHSRIFIAKNVSDFEKARALRHEIDHFFITSWERELFDAGLSTNKASWHDKAQEIRIIILEVLDGNF